MGPGDSADPGREQPDRGGRDRAAAADRGLGQGRGDHRGQPSTVSCFRTPRAARGGAGHDGRDRRRPLRAARRRMTARSASPSSPGAARASTTLARVRPVRSLAALDPDRYGRRRSRSAAKAAAKLEGPGVTGPVARWRRGRSRSSPTRSHRALGAVDVVLPVLRPVRRGRHGSGPARARRRPLRRRGGRRLRALHGQGSLQGVRYRASGCPAQLTLRLGRDPEPVQLQSREAGAARLLGRGSRRRMTRPS